MKHLMYYITRSTLKREFAGFVFLVWMVIEAYLTIRMPITQLVPDAALIQWSQLTPYVVTMVTAAFGADYLAKQTNVLGPATNTETTVKAELTDTAASVTTTSTETGEKP